KCNCAGIMLERVSGDISISLGPDPDNANSTTDIHSNSPGYGIYLKDCTGSITIDITDATLTGAGYPIVIENCNGTGKRISVTVTSSSGSDLLVGNWYNGPDLMMKGTNSPTTINGTEVSDGMNYNIDGNGTVSRVN
ncbi:MAG: hypothetical protein KBS81_03525, partial [Spirochaetales bacterium]|nr:hypothetical protein [Candidatus Physcosoma equi]